MSASRLQRLQAGFFQMGNKAAEHLQSAKSWCSEKLESEPVIRIKNIAKDAVSSAFGVHYLFDLGLSVIPATSACYNGIKIVKYTSTAITFGLSAYDTYQTNPAEKSHLFKLEKKLEEAQEVRTCAQALAENNKKLLELDGYTTSDLSVESKKTMTNSADNILADVEKMIGTQKQLEKAIKDYGEVEEQLQIVIETPKASQDSPVASKSTFSLLAESAPIIYIRSLIGGAKTASGVHYILELAMPKLAFAKYVAGITTLVYSTCETLKQFKDKAITEKNLQELSVEINKARTLIQYGKQLLAVQTKMVLGRIKQMHGHSPESKEIEKEDSDDDLLLDFDNLHSAQSSPQMESVASKVPVSPLAQHSFLKKRPAENPLSSSSKLELPPIFSIKSAS